GAGSFLHRVGPAVWPVDVQRKSLPLAAGHDAPDAAGQDALPGRAPAVLSAGYAPPPDGNPAYHVPHLYDELSSETRHPPEQSPGDVLVWRKGNEMRQAVGGTFPVHPPKLPAL